MGFFKVLLRVVAVLLVVAVAGGAAAYYLLPEGTLSGILGIGHTHNLTKVEKIEATCTEAGQEAYYTCDGCEEIFSDANGQNVIEAPKAIAALGHKISGVAGVEPTCTEAGAKDCYQCSRCEKLYADAKGETEIDAAEVVPALGHSFVKTDAKAVSCTENGNNAYWTCSVCGKVYSDEAAQNETTVADQIIATEGHSLTETKAKDVTCTEDGNKAYWTCGTCGDVFADENASSILEDTVIPAKGHSYSETLVVEGAVTTYEPGSSFDVSGLVVKLDCASCDHAEVVSDYNVSKLDNLQPEDTEIVISYTAEGKTYSATVAIIVKHEHSTGDLVAAVDPTCTEEGSVAYYECTVCKAKFEDKEATKPLDNIVVSAKGHSGVKTEAVDSTCTEGGNNAYWTCSVCGGVFKDEACTESTSVEAEQLPVAGHETEVKSDANGHWNECKNCDTYKTEAEAHTGIAYPDVAPVCTVCGTEFGEASWEGWVLFRPGVADISGGLITSASHVTVNGIMGSKYVIGAGSSGSESAIWTHSDSSAYNNGKYQVRIPTVGNNERYVYLYVSNDGDTAISFRIYSENYGDKGGVDVTLGAGASGYFKYSVHTGNTIGSNVNIKLLSDLEAETAITIYGYFYLEESEIANLAIANQNELKLSYEVGEKLDLSKIILSANIATDSEGGLLNNGGSVETYYIANNYTISGLEDGQVLEAGTYTVTVSFGGKSVELQVIVSSHTHDIQAVGYKAATCTEDGNNAHYKCVIDGCGQLFSDAEGKSPIDAASIVIAAGHSSAILPGKAEYCTRCGETLGTEVMSGEHWVLFRPEIAVGSGSFAGWKAEYTDVDGVYGSMLTFGAGVNAGDRIAITSWNEQGNFQTVIPNGLDAATANRIVIMYYHNYGTEPITLRYENDSNSSIYDEVTIPAGGVVVSTFEHPKSGGGTNWFYLQVKNDIQTDVTVGVYGYFYLENEFDSISVVNNATKLSFATGDTFTAEGLMLKTNGGIKYTFVETGYVTDLDGHVFTADDIGTKTVTVTFGGKTVTYEIEVTAHKHNLELIAGKAPVACVEDGVEDYYKCTIDGCDEKFSDANGNNKISAPVVISCHTPTTVLPGQAIPCANCGVEYAVRSSENWVFYNITTNYNNNGVVNGKLEAADIDGVSGTMIYIGAGTPGGTGANFQLCMGDNDAGKQTVIPNLGDGRQDGDLRHVVVFYKNYSNEAVTLNLQNDGSGGYGKVTIPANGTIICEFDIHNVGGSNWFNLYIDSDVTTDVQIGAYGYIYINDGEVSEISANTSAAKTEFKVGDSFSTEGLVVNAPIPSSNTKTVYATTGYTTNLDGVVFEAAGEYTVDVSFAGVTTTYTITVTE